RTLSVDGLRSQAARCRERRAASTISAALVGLIVREGWRTRTRARSGPDRGIAVRTAFPQREATKRGFCAAHQLSASCIESWEDSRTTRSGLNSPKPLVGNGA